MDSLPPSQLALDAFVISQLIDNGMDSIAKKINRLYLKLQRTHDDQTAQRRYVHRLHHYLTIACRLLSKQRNDVSNCIQTIELDLKRGVLGQSGDVSNHRDSAASTPVSQSRTMTHEVDDGLIIEPGRHVAAKVARSHELWILARIIMYDERTRIYEVEDVDTGEDEEIVTIDPNKDDDTSVISTPVQRVRRHHHVLRDQVKSLPADSLSADQWIQYAVNQRVMAIYPNTTSFYRGVVRVPNPKGSPYILVRFDDDADEYGSQAIDRKIPFRLVLSV